MVRLDPLVSWSDCARGTPLGTSSRLSRQKAIFITDLSKLDSPLFQSLAAQRGSSPIHPPVTVGSEEKGKDVKLPTVPNRATGAPGLGSWGTAEHGLSRPSFGRETLPAPSLTASLRIRFSSHIFKKHFSLFCQSLGAQGWSSPRHVAVGWNRRVETRNRSSGESQIVSRDFGSRDSLGRPLRGWVFRTPYSARGGTPQADTRVNLR